MAVICSNGANEARAYLTIEVRASRPEPAVEIERVKIVDPRQTSTLRLGARPTTSGPRDPEGQVWPPPAPPGIELPDALPATKAQRVYIDPELVARWRAEAKMKESA